ncbi:MAG: DNA cytosine methyltransferase [Pseudomonadota bacterium]
MRTEKATAQHDLFAEEISESLGELFGNSDVRARCLEFFAGSGLASEGLKAHFKTVWANDNCIKKQVVYRANHNTPFLLDTIENVRGAALPSAQLAWASFPCQDLSLAGNMGGLDAERSGMVWQWLRVMDEMPHPPSILVAENVVGLVSVEGGTHYQRLHQELVVSEPNLTC